MPSCQRALILAGETVIEHLGHHQPQHPVAEKFQALIRASAGAAVAGLQAGMGQGLFEQLGLVEIIAEQIDQA